MPLVRLSEQLSRPFARADLESQRRAELQVQETLERGTYVFPGLWCMIVYMTGLWHYHRAVSVLMTVAWAIAITYRVRALRESRLLGSQGVGRSRLLMRLGYFGTAVMWGITEIAVGSLHDLSWGIAFCLCVSGVIGAISWSSLAPDYSHGWTQQTFRTVCDVAAVLVAGGGSAQAWSVAAVVVIYTGFAVGQGFGAYRGYWKTMRDRRALEELHSLGLELGHCDDPDSVGTLIESRLQPLLQLDHAVVGAESGPGGNDSHCRHLAVCGGHLEFSRQTPLDEHERTIAFSFLNLASSAFSRHRMLEALRSSARRDGLTQVHNRGFFFETAEGSLKASRRLAWKTGVPVAVTALMLDIDHFKLINDQYGHAVGDEVLKSVAQRCQKSLRETDVFGRFGGEEFCALLLGSNQQETAITAAERLRRAIADKAFEVETGSLQVTVSIGVAELRPEETVELALKRADRALYRAKEGGRNRVCCAPLPATE